MSIAELSANQLRRAAKIKDKIEALQQQLSKIIDGSAKVGNGKTNLRSTKNNSPRRRMSAAGRARIAAAAKARWAKVKAAGKKHL